MEMDFSPNNIIENFSCCRLDPALKNMDVDGQLRHLLSQQVTEDNFNILKDLVRRGADPNIIDSEGNSLIHLAIMKCPDTSDKLVSELIRRGVNINIVNKYGSTHLTFSLYFKRQKTTQLLIKRGINLNFQCPSGWTALMIASMLGDWMSVRTMLVYGANVNAYDTTGKTALMFAVEGRFLKVVKKLLKYGANPNMRDRSNKTALKIVLERPYPQLDAVNELLLHCASYRNLENSLEASFLKIMQICMRGGPSYQYCVKTVIKIQVLLTNDHHCAERFRGFSEFAESCLTEVRHMMRFDVNAMNSVDRFIATCMEGSMPIESELEALLHYVANNKFPIYNDILRALIRKSYYREKFLTMLMYAKVKVENQEKEIILIPDINVRIMSYLTQKEISSFVLAFYLETNSQESIRSRDSYLYPSGNSCNWNDLVAS